MDYTILAAQLAVSAASVAAAVFIPPPFGFIVSTAISLVGNMMVQGLSGSIDPLSMITTIASAAIAGLKELDVFTKIGKSIGEALPKFTENFNKITMNFKRLTETINSKIANSAPNKLIAKAVEKWGGSSSDTLFEDNKLIMKKSAELETFGEVRTDKKIISTKFNPDPTS